MEGLSYIERHLGYRLVLSDVFMQHDFWEDTTEIKVSLKNVGFAPVYKECEPVFLVKDEPVRRFMRESPQGILRHLPGENEAEKKGVTF